MPLNHTSSRIELVFVTQALFTMPRRSYGTIECYQVGRLAPSLLNVLTVGAVTQELLSRIGHSVTAGYISIIRPPKTYYAIIPFSLYTHTQSL